MRDFWQEEDLHTPTEVVIDALVSIGGQAVPAIMNEFPFGRQEVDHFPDSYFSLRVLGAITPSEYIASALPGLIRHMSMQVSGTWCGDDFGVASVLHTHGARIAALLARLDLHKETRPAVEMWRILGLRDMDEWTRYCAKDETGVYSLRVVPPWSDWQEPGKGMWPRLSYPAPASLLLAMEAALEELKKTATDRRLLAEATRAAAREPDTADALSSSLGSDARAAGTEANQADAGYLDWAEDIIPAIETPIRKWRSLRPDSPQELNIEGCRIV
jgi:hypothetical protein